jgi:catalase-peroxidase
MTESTGTCPFGHGSSDEIGPGSSDETPHESPTVAGDYSHDSARDGHRSHPTQGSANREWWPSQLNLKILAKNTSVINPLDEDFSYRAAFQALDLDAVKADLRAAFNDSQEWWPADFGHYGPVVAAAAAACSASRP